LGTKRPFPSPPVRLVGTVTLAAAVAPELPAHRRRRSSKAKCNLSDRLAHCNATGNLFAFLKPERGQSSPARRRRDAAIERHDSQTPSLVPPIQGPRDRCST